MLCLEEIKKKMQDTNLSAAARSMGMHRQQLWRIINYKQSNPTNETLLKISSYLEKR